MCTRPSSGARRALSDRHDHCETMRVCVNELTTDEALAVWVRQDFLIRQHSHLQIVAQPSRLGSGVFRCGPDGGLNIWLTGRVGLLKSAAVEAGQQNGDPASRRRTLRSTRS